MIVWLSNMPTSERTTGGSSARSLLPSTQDTRSQFVVCSLRTWPSCLSCCDARRCLSVVSLPFSHPNFSHQLNRLDSCFLGCASALTDVSERTLLSTRLRGGGTDDSVRARVPRVHCIVQNLCSISFVTRRTRPPVQRSLCTRCGGAARSADEHDAVSSPTCSLHRRRRE